MKVIRIEDDYQIRLLDGGPLDRHRILSELVGLADGYKTTGWPIADPTIALERIRHEFIFVYLPSGGMMAISSNLPWFATEYVLCEEWLGAGVTTEQAVLALTAIAKEFKLNRFEVGTRAAPGQRHEAAARLFQRQGLRLSTCTLEGVIHEQESITQGVRPIETS